MEASPPVCNPSDPLESATAHALRRRGLLAHEEYLHAIKDRASLVVVEIPSYFASASPGIPMIVNDYKKYGYNSRRAEEMLNNSVLWDASMDRPCDCLGGPKVRFEVTGLGRIENKTLFERFKCHEASVAQIMGQSTAAFPALYDGHEWLRRLADRN